MLPTSLPQETAPMTPQGKIQAQGNSKRRGIIAVGVVLLVAGVAAVSTTSSFASHTAQQETAATSSAALAQGHTSEVKPAGGGRINQVYYQNSAGKMICGENCPKEDEKVKAGEDFDVLRKVGVNTLTVGFYNPLSLLTGKFESYAESAIDDEDKLAELGKNWQKALGDEFGAILVSIGGMTSKKEDWESAFADGAKLGAAYGKALSSLRKKTASKSMQIGLDIDVEGPCDKDKQCGQAVRSQLGPFLKALRANGCPHDSCPVQLDVTLTFYFVGAEGRRWTLDAIKENGPTGNPTEGVNYVSMMVNNVATSGTKQQGYINGINGPTSVLGNDNTAVLDEIAPKNTRIINFWGPNDGAMTTKNVKLFVEDPGLAGLWTFMKDGGMGAAWFSWEATKKNGGSDIAYANMKTLNDAVFK